MKGAAVGILVVLLVAGCSSYDGGAARRAGNLHRPGQTPATTVAAAVEPPDAPDGSGTPLPAAAVLHAWDRRRAHAWATGDEQALADLYTAGSAAGRADVAMLRAYLNRGLRVTGLRMQVFAVRVLDHRPGLWRLRVTDRLARAVAVGAGGTVRLPRDGAATRVISLVRGRDGQWRVSVVRAVRR
ncbi:MAG TPA: hypothetical protein VFJ09_04510 [Nocardioidaceae bacterium]|nr:hypothetical protein [Nocardioidaceae bacterium]